MKFYFKTVETFVTNSRNPCWKDAKRTKCVAKGQSQINISCEQYYLRSKVLKRIISGDVTM